MARYTVELSALLMAFSNTHKLLNPNTDEKDVELDYPFDCDPNFKYKMHEHKFDYLRQTNPNLVIDKYAPAFMRYYLVNIPENYTDDPEINKAITDQLLKTFVRHFYGWEIGQENPNLWWVVLQGFFDEYLPIYIQEYQQMMINNQLFITNVADRNGTAKNTGTNQSDTTTKNSGLNALADTPQNELNFKINTGDPTDDYNFNYATNVSGSKNNGQSDTTSKSENDGEHTEHSQGRSESIASLINELESFANGLYVNLFEHAITYGLFLQIRD